MRLARTHYSLTMPINRKRFSIHSLLLLIVAACSAQPKLSPITTADHTKAWETWKASRVKWLHTPNRPASYTGLTWLKQGPNSIGSDTKNDVVLPGRGVPAKLGTLVREGRRVRFDPVPKTEVTVDSQPFTGGYLRNDNDSGGAAGVRLGTAGFRIIRRVDSVGVRAWDSDP